MEDEPGSSSWSRGRLDARTGPGHLLFGRMYEDAALELRLFPPGGRIFCIASAGCTAIALSPRHEVVAVDVNSAQIEYVRHRVAGGAPRPGQVDRGMSALRACAPAIGWNARRTNAFLALQDPDEQTAAWRKHFDTTRFRAALDFVLSPALMQLVYARPLLQALPSRFGRVLRGRLERGFARHPNCSNPHARALLAGEWGTPTLPREARSIRLACADAAEFLEREPPASFDAFTLSNILDGAGESGALRLWQAVRRAGKAGAIALLRSFAEPRDPAHAMLAAEDRSMLWGSVEARLVE